MDRLAETAADAYQDYPLHNWITKVAYLETNKETNVRLYQYYGLSLIKEDRIPGTPVMHYAMVRHPQV